MPKQEKTTRISISLPESLLENVDDRIVRRGYSSRSEFVRDLIRERIIEDTWKSARDEVVGVLSILYDHHRRDLPGRLVKTQHSHYVTVLCSTHVHLDHDLCLETIIMKGKPPEIERVSLEIAGLKGVTSAGLTRASRVDV